MKNSEGDMSNHDPLQEEIQSAVERADDVKETVKQITIKALTERKLDKESLRQVINSVTKGAGLGAATRANESEVKNVLANALNGLDEALSASAEASKLAMEEAAGNLKEFGRNDLKQALDELATLEEMYLDTLKRVARNSDETIGNILNDLIQHACHSGTAVGQQSREIVDKLNRDLAHTLNDTLIGGADVALKVSAQLSRAAAGFLEGIAQTLERKTKHQSPDRQE